MAEKVTVAAIDMDDIPLRASVNRSRAEVSKMDNSFAALTGRMFSLRNAVRVALGSFTLAGIVLGLKNVITESLRLDTTYHRLTATFSVLSTSFAEGIRGITILNDLLQKLPDIILKIGIGFGTVFSPEGIKTVFTDGFDGLTALFESRLRDATARRDREVLREFLGLPTDAEIRNIATLSAQALESFGKGFLNGTVEAEKFLRVMQTVIGKLGGAGEFAEAANVAQLAVAAVVVKFQEGELSASGASRALTQLRAALAATGADDKLLRQLDRLVPLLTKLKIGVQDFAASLRNDLQPAVVVVTLMKSAMDAATQAIAQGLVEGGLTFKKVIAGILRALAYELVALGVKALVLGFIFKDASMFKAAGIAFAGAAAAGAAASSLGGGSASVQSPASSGQTAPAGGGLQQNISLAIFGNPTDEQVRSITRSVARALRDGVEGGSLVAA